MTETIDLKNKKYKCECKNKMEYHSSGPLIVIDKPYPYTNEIKRTYESHLFFCLNADCQYFKRPCIMESDLIIEEKMVSDGRCY